VCLFWGTTYLGIRVGLESFTPAMLMCLRYLISGILLLIGAIVAGAHLPRGRELWRTALYGALTIGMGTGSLALAEVWIPSGLAALIVSIQPFWMVGVESLAPGGERLHFSAVRGMLVGLAGVAFLIAPAAFASATNSQALLKGFVALQIGAAVWSLGSISQRRLVTRAHPIVSGAVQQFATGLAFVIPALLQSRSAVWDAKGIGAVVYLAIFGGVIGYSAFIFSMDRLPVALVSIYTYVNPIIAVLLGWVFYRETLGWREVVAMLIIFTGVAMVKRSWRAAESVPIE
jgi:drug/metabolite transporter (DMT)-like permease